MKNLLVQIHLQIVRIGIYFLHDLDDDLSHKKLGLHETLWGYINDRNCDISGDIYRFILRFYFLMSKNLIIIF